MRELQRARTVNYEVASLMAAFKGHGSASEASRGAYVLYLLRQETLWGLFRQAN